MKQSRSTSLIKSLVNTVVGFAVAMAANAIVLPWFGWSPSISENLLLTTIYTVISIARGYLLERAFEAAGWRTKMSAFALAVLAERQRQINSEGWTPDHDDDHQPGELAEAAATYAGHAFDDWRHPAGIGRRALAELEWPWNSDSYKPTAPRRDLAKAAALILAEGERFDRNRKRKPDAVVDRTPPLPHVELLA